MKTKFHFLAVPIAILFSVITAKSQDSSVTQKFPATYPDHISKKVTNLKQKLNKKSKKALALFQKQETRIKNKLTQIDSIVSKRVFAGTENKYSQLEQKLKQPDKLTPYIPQWDTLLSSVKFLNENKQILLGIKDIDEKLGNNLEKINEFESQLQKAEDIKKFIKERKQYLKEQLSRFGFARELKKMNKQVYYFGEQLNEYKSMLKDHKKIERKAIEWLSKAKPFRDFMKKNSVLASLFRLPGNPDDPQFQAGLGGLQTRAQVNNLIQQQIATGGPNAQAQLQQNLREAQSQIQELKNKVSHLANGSADTDIPDFKPNNQKTKSFFKRLEFGTNFQTQKSTTFFPATSDIGLSIGYKLNDKSIIGIGTSYKIGWGRSWKQIKLTQEGIGIRTYADWKLKGSFWLSVGYELNYKASFRNIDQLKNLNAWQQSGLAGISKVLSLTTKFFKKTKLQLLWDFLSYKQIPASHPIIFRIGYNLK